MTLVALCSGKGSPGVSTLTCVAGAVWPAPRRIVLAECDPSGNDLAARFGLSPRFGMASLVLSNRRTGSSVPTFDEHVQTLPGGLETLVGPVTLDAAGSLDRELAIAGPGIFPAGVDMMVDCGRILSDAPGQREILRAADHVVVVTRPDAAGLAHALWTLDVARTLGTEGTISLVVVGVSRFPDKEIEQALKAPLLGTIPVDEKSAAMACGLPGKAGRFARSNLVASSRRLVDRILHPVDLDGDAYDGTAFGGKNHVKSLLDAPFALRPRFQRAGPGQQKVDPQ